MSQQELALLGVWSRVLDEERLAAAPFGVGDDRQQLLGGAGQSVGGVADESLVTSRVDPLPDLDEDGSIVAGVDARVAFREEVVLGEGVSLRTSQGDGVLRLAIQRGGAFVVLHRD